MTPDEVELPFAPAKKDPHPAQSDKPPRINRPPEPISESALAELRQHGSIRVNGMEVLGDYDKFPDTADIPVRFCCHCKRWDLSKDTDRSEYGDLMAKSLSPNPSIEVNWEERCKEDSGLIIYLTYFEYVRVAEVRNA